MSVNLQVFDSKRSAELTRELNVHFRCGRDDIQFISMTAKNLIHIFTDCLHFEITGIAGQRFQVDDVVLAIRACRHWYDDDSYEGEKLDAIRKMCEKAIAVNEDKLFYS